MSPLPQQRPTWKSTTSTKVENIIKIQINHNVYVYSVDICATYNDHLQRRVIDHVDKCWTFK